MAKSKIDYWLTEEGLARITGWARDGLTEVQIAKNIPCARSTLSDWKKKHDCIATALRSGKEAADRIVENALFIKATGHKETVQKAVKVKSIIFNNGKKVKETEEIEYVDEEVYYPPDTLAQMYWLNNRKPQTWRQKPKDDFETSGINISFDNPDTEEWAK
jgi:hypothetical protein